MTAGADRVGVLVVRVWFEDADGSLRARITQRLDVMSTEQSSQVVVTIDGVLVAIRESLGRFVAGSP